jgi:SAM-dependent methyltransferase
MVSSVQTVSGSKRTGLAVIKGRLKRIYALHIARYIARNVRQTVLAGLRMKKAAGGAYGHSGSVRDAADRAWRIASEFRARACDLGVMNPGRVIEIGPGDSLAPLILWIGFGAHSVTGLECYGDGRDSRRERAILMDLLDRLSPEERKRILAAVDLNGDELRLDAERIRYVSNAPVEQLGNWIPVNSADLIISNAVLEHVRGLEEGLRRMYWAVKPGGVMIHRVDLRNHGVLADFGDHAFLRPPDFLWRLMGSASGSFPNRKDLGTYERVLEECGARVEVEPTWKPAASLAPETVRCGRAECNGFWLTAWKAADRI